MGQKAISLKVDNTLDFARSEIVGIPKSSLQSLLKNNREEDVMIIKSRNSDCVVIQWIDNDSDGEADELLFQANVGAKSSAEYFIRIDSKCKIAEPGSRTFSRFVPERTDDYAWENDKVAFRTYGPDAQQRFEQKRDNGTLSSGIDLWLKRTDKPIIDKWYKGYLTNPMFYHEDHGEGYDPYHVGASRGTGGTGIWENDSLYVSKNFVSYKTIAVGPLRTVFELIYAPYSRFEVAETKRISLDIGSNFSRIEVTYTSNRPLPNFTVGITLHDNKGQPAIDSAAGIFKYAEVIDGNWISEAIIMDPKNVSSAFANISKTADQSNLLIESPATGRQVYYAGFMWEKSGQADGPYEWEQLVGHQSLIHQYPMRIKLY